MYFEYTNYCASASAVKVITNYTVKNVSVLLDQNVTSFSFNPCSTCPGTVCELAAICSWKVLNFEGNWLVISDMI